MQYRHCVFDLYGTLVDIRTEEDEPALWAKTAALYAERGAVYAPEELRRAYFGLIAAREREMAPAGHEGHPEIRLEHVFQQLYLDRGAACSLEEARAAALAFRRWSTRYIRLYPGAKELLTALREVGRGVWLLSNAQRCFTAPELEELGLAPLFDGVFLSSDYGCKKPDLRFFAAFLDGSGVEAAEAVMVGNDGFCDIRGGKAAGMAAVYIRSNLSPNEPDPPADRLVEGFDPAALRAILLA